MTETERDALIEKIKIWLEVNAMLKENPDLLEQIQNELVLELAKDRVEISNLETQAILKKLAIKQLSEAPTV